MVKLEYLVIKNFDIAKTKKGERVLADPSSDERTSSSFVKGNQYVDYDIPDYEITQSKLTKRLLKEKYIELVKTTNPNEKKEKDS